MKTTKARTLGTRLAPGRVPVEQKPGTDVDDAGDAHELRFSQDEDHTDERQAKDDGSDMQERSIRRVDDRNRNKEKNDRECCKAESSDARGAE